MSAIERFLRRVVRQGELRVITADGRHFDVGAPDPARRRITLRMTDRRVGFDILRHPRLGVAETFMDGRLVIEEGDIMALIDLVRFNGRWEKGGPSLAAPNPFKRHLGNLRSKLDRLNWEAKSRRNVAHHYDLGDRLYDLFLDADRQYSCAYFTDPDGGWPGDWTGRRPTRRRISPRSWRCGRGSGCWISAAAGAGWRCT